MTTYAAYSLTDTKGTYAVTSSVPVATDITVSGEGPEASELSPILNGANNEYIYGAYGSDQEGASASAYVGVATASNNVTGFIVTYDGTSYLLVPSTETDAPSTGSLTVKAYTSTDGTTEWDLDTPGPYCFLAGTLIATPAGEVAVENLKACDLILTADGKPMPVRWVGRQTVSRVFADPLRVLPVRIAAGALDEALPGRDLLVSPDHALLVDGALIQAGALVNGTTIRREHGVPAVFTYYHVELAEHSLILAEGAPAETFIGNVDRMAFDNWQEHRDLDPERLPMAEMEVPRAKSQRQVPVATRDRLAERAALLAGAPAQAA